MSITTKRALAASLKKLMIKTPLDKITVKDIVADCQVNRQTFYYHFQDVYALLEWIYETEAFSSIDKFKTYNTWQHGFLMVFNYASDNKNFCLNTYRSNGRKHLELYLYKLTYNLLIDVVNEIAQESPVSQSEKHFIANFYTYGFIGLLISWIKEGMNDDPEVLIDELNKLIEGDIKKAIS